MITYLGFQKRMRPLTRNASKHSYDSNVLSMRTGNAITCIFAVDDDALSQYIDGFDSVLKSIGWSESDLLNEIDKNWN
jgi:hypothetical protein